MGAPPAGWLAQLRAAGVDVPDGDESKAIQALKEHHQKLQEYRQLDPYVRSYQQHAPAFSAWLRQQHQTQQQPQSPQPSQPASPARDKPWYAEHWSPPEYNPAWEKMVTRNPDGSLALAPGAPPDTIQRIQNYAMYRQEQMDRFMTNPFEYLEPAVERAVSMAEEKARGIVEDRLRQREEIAQASQFVQTNASWLYQRGPDGAVAMQSQFNPYTGQYIQTPALNEWGQLLHQTVKAVAEQQQKRGYSDQQEQIDLAMLRVQNAYMAQQLQKQGGQPPPAAAAPASPAAPQLSPEEQRRLAIAKQHNPPAGSAPPSSGDASPAPFNQRSPKRKLAAAMLQKFANSGDDRFSTDE